MTRRWPLLLAAAIASSAQSQQPPEIVTLVPAGFKGWVCTDFGLSQAPPLPREGRAMIVRARPGEVIKTSDKAIPFSPDGHDYFTGPVWVEDAGRRQALPGSLKRQATGFSVGFPARPVQRLCTLFGSPEDPPERFANVRTSHAVSPDEREALIELYKNTEGPHWKENTGWLGPEGTECEWHVVRCRQGFYGVTAVEELDLFDNGLTGRVPAALARLEGLTWLRLRSNHLSGMLPSALLERWRSGELRVSAEDSLLTDLSEIDFEFSSSSILCAMHRIVL